MPFTPAALRFFRGLAKNNNKEWFEAHRADYEGEVREPMRDLIGEMNARFTKFAPEIGGDPKRSMFRINRDIRFSSDKSPYKTHAACWFHHRRATSRVGSEADAGSAGFYFHLEPGKSFVGGGLWMPPRPQLNRLRDAIAHDPVVASRAAESLPVWIARNIVERLRAAATAACESVNGMVENPVARHSTGGPMNWCSTAGEGNGE